MTALASLAREEDHGGKADLASPAREVDLASPAREEDHGGMVDLASLAREHGPVEEVGGLASLAREDQPTEAGVVAVDTTTQAGMVIMMDITVPLSQRDNKDTSVDVPRSNRSSALHKDDIEIASERKEDRG
jgi:hypothetical protein